MDRTAKNPRPANLARLLAPTLPVADASVEDLKLRVQSTIRAQNQAAAIRAEAVSELRRRQGSERAETVLQEEGLLSRRRARSEVETARELSELPETSEGLRNGDISHDNARILAAAHKRGKIDEGELVDDARTQSPDKFAATVRKHEQRRSEDDGVTKLEHQRSRRFARIKTDREDGMTVLYGRFDPVTGARIETVLSKKMNELWQEEDRRDRATPGQRMADALESLLTRPPGEEDGRPQDVRLLLVAQYDAVSRQMGVARLADGTPIPAKALRKLACDAQILPAIFAGSSQPLDLGRARRKASPAQRIALIARDGACVGCGAKAAWCQAHHVKHWQDGGPTNLENMCLLCSRCHHKVHDQDWRVARDSTGAFSLRPPPAKWGRSPRPGHQFRGGRRSNGARQRK